MDRDSATSGGTIRRPQVAPIGAGGAGSAGGGPDKPESGSMANIAGHGDGRGSLLRKASISTLMLRGRSKLVLNNGGAGSIDGGHTFRAAVAEANSEDPAGSGCGAGCAALVLPRMQSALSTPSVFETILPRPRADGDGRDDDEVDDGAGAADDAIAGEEGELDSGGQVADDRTDPSSGTATASRRTSMISRAPMRNEEIDPAQAAVVEEKMLFSNAPVKRTRVEERIMHMYEENYLAFLVNRSKMNVLTPIEEARLNKLAKKYKKILNGIYDKAKKQKQAMDNLTKNDRRTAILQEWAFWNYHRPIDAKRIFEHMVDPESKSMKTERDFEASLKGEALLEFAEKKLAQLEVDLNRECLPVSTISGCHIKTCEILAAFDPFLETYTGVKANPFTFEDPKRETARIQPDIHELRLWCQSISHLLRDPEGAAAFTEFLKQKSDQPALNALGFLAKAAEVSDASFDTHAHFVDAAAAVANDFLVDDAPSALPDETLPAQQRRALATTIATAGARCAAARAVGVTAIIGMTTTAGGRAGRPGSVVPGIRTGSGSGVFMPGMPLTGRRGSSGTTSSGGSANSASARVGARPLTALEPLDEAGAMADTATATLQTSGPVSESVDGVQPPSTSSGPRGGASERDSMIAYVPLDCDVFQQAILSVREGLAKGAYVRFLQSDTTKAHLARVEVASTNDEDFRIAVAARRKKK